MTTRQQFDEFIATYIDSAQKIAEIYIKNPEDARDVAAESIEKALRNIDSIKDSGKMKPWFNRIIMNTAIDFLRTQPKTEIIETPVYHYDDLSHLNIEYLLDMLPDGDRQIVSMRFCDEYSLKEIADALGMNENTVKTRLYRALKKLKLEITDEGRSVKVRKDKSTLKTVTVTVVAILISAVAIFNFSPTLSAAAYDIPVLGDIIKVITFNRFEYKDGGYSAEIVVPEIQGLLDPELQARLNTEFSGNADDLIRSFEATILEAEEFGTESGNMSIKADYVVKTDNDRVLSLDTYIFSEVGGYVLHKLYTLDKESGRRVELKDLFKSDADYITPISAYIVKEMERLNAEEGGVYFIEGSEYQGNHFTVIRPDHSFYINNEDKLVICFDKHEVGAGFMGSPEFVIPTDVVKDISGSYLIVK